AACIRWPAAPHRGARARFARARSWVPPRLTRLVPSQRRVEIAPRDAQAPVDRVRFLPEHFGNLRHRELLELDEDEDLAPRIVELLEERLHRAHRLGRLGGLVRTIAARDRELVERRHWLRAAPSQRAPAVAYDVEEDPVHPRLHRRAPLELAQAPMNDEKDLLEDVLDRRGRDPEVPCGAPHEGQMFVIDSLELLHLIGAESRRG